MTNLILTVTLLLNMSVLQRVDSPSHREKVAKTGSMLPNIPVDSMLIVDEAFYAAKQPRRFDIVVVRRSFRNPVDRVEMSMDVVARVIGLPGETIALRSGRVYINGRRIREPFAVKQCPSKVEESFPCGEMSAMKIPGGEYFLLADNRAGSEDSRLWSPQTIPKSDVLGKVVKIVMPSTYKRLQQRVVSETARYSRPYILFADFLIDSHLYCFKYETEEKSSVGVDYLNGEEPELVAASVEEFFEILNGDAARLKMFE